MRLTPNEVTVASYEQHSASYISANAARPGPLEIAFMERLAALLPTGARVLELGTGPGRDADVLERLGLRVDRTDVTRAFVERLRAAGHSARVLDALTAEWKHPHAAAGEAAPAFDAVFASAVFLHFSRENLRTVLTTAARHTSLLAFTIRDDDGEVWVDIKGEELFHFTYWREAALRQLLSATGWDVVELTHVSPRSDWMYVIARSRPPRVQ
ncbi:MAG: class I SAM-dependent DNA methyltransferase [Microbacteriaceae bacterium]